MTTATHVLLPALRRGNRAAKCRHSLNDVTGYDVVRTFRDGKRIPERDRILIARVNGPNRAATASQIAHEYRNIDPATGWPDSWAVVLFRYRCGCTETL